METKVKVKKPRGRGYGLTISLEVARELAKRFPGRKSYDAALRELLSMPPREKPSQALARLADESGV